MEKRILVALDYSENSMKAVRFVAITFTRDHNITLFSVIPDTYSIYAMYSPELAPTLLSEQSFLISLENIIKEKFSAAQSIAREILVKAGFSEEKILSKTQIRKKSVAKDIIDEFDSGYDLVVFGRRGISGIKEFFLGSVSHKVLSSIRDATVFIVD